MTRRASPLRSAPAWRRSRSSTTAIEDYRSLDTPTLIADDFFNAGCVLGDPVESWRELDLAAVQGRMTINGGEVGRGRGGDILGHPLKALAWLANALAARGRDSAGRRVRPARQRRADPLGRGGRPGRDRDRRPGPGELRASAELPHRQPNVTVADAERLCGSGHGPIGRRDQPGARSSGQPRDGERRACAAGDRPAGRCNVGRHHRLSVGQGLDLQEAPVERHSAKSAAPSRWYVRVISPARRRRASSNRISTTRQTADHEPAANARDECLETRPSPVSLMYHLASALRVDIGQVNAHPDPARIKTLAADAQPRHVGAKIGMRRHQPGGYCRQHARDRRPCLVITTSPCSSSMRSSCGSAALISRTLSLLHRPLL